ncbi:MAG: 2'-5' RNA ligase family protein [candidate division Zixibacteria bacterium]|nr:2'-5' RNA ligase family protein [candidate division Zixibacteria bacterium]
MESYFNFGPEKERRHVQYALVLFLPAVLDDLISPIREKYDPVYSQMPAHIPLVFPFETTRSLDDLASVITDEMRLHRAITVEMDSIGDFYPGSPVIYWSAMPNETLNDLYYSLYSRLEIPIPFKKFKPHVVVAREVSSHRVLIVKEAIVSSLSQEKFTADAVDLVTPLMDNKWVSVRTFSLAE